MKCDFCEEEIVRGQSYIKFEGERACSKCCTKHTTINYYIGGEFLGTDDDGVEEFGGYNGTENIDCKHKNIVVDSFGLSAWCKDCGFEPNGWYCKDSPTLECEYYDATTGCYDEDCCIYCGQPEERK